MIFKLSIPIFAMYAKGAEGKPGGYYMDMNGRHLTAHSRQAMQARVDDFKIHDRMTNIEVADLGAIEVTVDTDAEVDRNAIMDIMSNRKPVFLMAQEIRAAIVARMSEAEAAEGNR